MRTLYIVLFLFSPIMYYCNAQCMGGNYEALVSFYNSTNGKNWANKWDLSECDYCQWYGVSCNEEQLVDSLILINNNLSGSILSNLGSLNGLIELDLNRNDLTGSIPITIGSLGNLISLDLSSNRIFGEIPNELGGLMELRELRLGDNKLRGEIPAELGLLTNLRHLGLLGNRLTGSIPIEMGNLVNLQHMSLSFNSLTGEIPVEFGNLSELTALYLNINLLTGYLPYELGELHRLHTLWLSSNQLTGSIPSSFGDLINLRSIDLSNNKLSGCYPIELLSSPSDICQFTNSSISNENNFDATWEAFCASTEGVCLASQCNGIDYSALAALYKSTEGRNWKIGWDLNDCDYCNWFGVGCDENGRVHFLDVAFNGLSGNIPAEIGNLSKLLVLNLGINQLHGSIPNDIGKLENLLNLNLSENNLTGEIPKEISNLKNLTGLNLQSNELSGCYAKELLSGPLDMCQFDNVSISFGNNFVSQWDNFCSTSQGICSNISTEITNLKDIKISRFFPVLPNPVSDDLQVGFYIEDPDEISFSVFDISGIKIQGDLEQLVLKSGYHTIKLKTQALKSGIYFLRVQGHSVHYAQQFIKI